MSSEYTYDEEGEVWPYFVLAVLSFIMVPITIKYLMRILYDKDNILEHNKSIEGSILENEQTLEYKDSANAESIKRFKRHQTSDKILNKTLIILILGWGAILYIALYLTGPGTGDGLSFYDPYEILGIASSSTEKQIKSHYRKLSLKFHPDKMPKDLSEAEKLTFEQDYIHLNKAYKALTDEVTRENFLKYGHPDGRQDVSHGIAIPKFLVEGKYSLLMIGFYFVLIGFILPYVVGSWWNNVKSHTSKGLHVNTATNFAKFLTDRNPAKIITPLDVLVLLLRSEEFSGFNLSVDQMVQLVEDYFNRVTDKSNNNSELTKLNIVTKLPELINGFIEIAIVFRQPEIILSALDLQKSVIQAVKPRGRYQDLLQLPYVDEEVVVKQPIKKLGKLFTLSREDLKKALGINDDKKLDKTMEVAAKISTLRVIDCDFKVPGEPTVTPASKAHVSLKFLIKSPKLKSCPEIDEELLKDDAEDMEYMKDPTKVNTIEPTLPFSYCPYYPNDVLNNWTGILVNQKDNKIVENSTLIKVTNVDLRNIKLTQDEWVKGDKAFISKFNIPFPEPTPNNVGTYPYRLVLKNNSYFGVDLDIPVNMVVKPVPPAPLNKDKIMGKKKEEDSDEDSDDESDISDPEEDSLAGALAALRGQPVKKAKIEEIKEEDAGEENDDNDDDDDDESIFTDINTDTEDEEEPESTK